jgi:hypothetical protein
MEIDITLRISSEVEPSRFKICEKVGDGRIVKFDGELEDLSDNLIAVGILKEIQVRDGNIYLVINEADKERFFGEGNC